MQTPSSLLRQTAEQWMIEIWHDRYLTNFNHIHHPLFVDRSPNGRATNRDAYKASIVELFFVFPDFCATIEDLIIDVDQHKVAIRWQASGTHQQSFMGIPPTHKLIQFTGIEIISVNSTGQIMERWGEWDGLSIRNQLLTH